MSPGQMQSSALPGGQVAHPENQNEEEIGELEIMRTEEMIKSCPSGSSKIAGYIGYWGTGACPTLAFSQVKVYQFYLV